MLLATPGQTATYVCSHAPASGNNSSINSNHAKSHKLGRSTYKLIESQNNTTSTTSKTTSATTTTQAAVLMKTIAVRANRNSGFHSVTQSVQANNINGLNYVKKQIVTAATNGNNISRSNNKHISSSAANSKSNVVAATTISSSTSSSSASASSSSTTKVVLSASFLKTYTVPPTDLHRYSAARSRSYSADSLYDEMCHFKPIRPVPTTLWKCGSKSRGVTIKAPKACLGQKTSSCDVELNTPRIRNNLKRDCSKAKAKIKPKLSANLFPHLKPHPSAFVRLLLPTCSYTIPASTQRQCKRLQKSNAPKTSGKRENNAEKTTKNTKKQLKSKNGKKQPKKAQIKAKQSENAIKSSKVSNIKKRKTQTQPKKCEPIVSKRVKSNIVNRKTPPLTRRRIRLDENCKLYGPLA